MPTYAIYTHAAALTNDQRDSLARLITARHSKETGAPPSFVQIVFQELSEQGHYIGGQPTDRRSVYIHGHIRDGRGENAKSNVALGIRDDVVETVGVPNDLVWVYISEIPADQMIEFGRPLPLHGQEYQWMDALPAPLRERLETLDAQAAGWLTANT
ncbi:tautomerase family protein [Streptomyces sp. NPDC005917]|uniref:tautomerase family protein n=1 Tax=unclassified Streptomyces TaxID=2593676 RepID=UPI0033DE0367